MFKNKFINCLLSLLLALTIILNTNYYRRDTYAVLPAFAFLPVVVETGEVVVTFGAAAVAGLAGYIVAMGITADTSGDIEYLTEEWIRWDIDTYGWEHTRSILENETGFVVEEFTEPTGEVSYGVDVPQEKASTWYKNPDGTLSNLKFFQNEKLGSGSAPSPDNKNGGKRLIAGVMAGLYGLSSIGNSFYDFLHSSDNVVYVPPFVADLGNFEDIRLFYYTFQQDMASSTFGYVFTQDDKALTYYSIPDSFSDKYKYFRFYYNYYPYETLEKYENLLYFACLAWNDDGSYSILTNNIRQHDNSGTSSDGTIRHSLSTVCKSGTDMVSDDIYNVKLNFGLNKSYKTLNDLSEVGYYVNSNYDTDTATDIQPDFELGRLDIGDTEFGLKEGDNIYENEYQLQEKAQQVANSQGELLVAAPAFNPDGSLVVESDTEPTAITSPLVSPDIELDNKPADSVMQGNSIFDLLKEFFNNFFTRLGQTLINAAKNAFVPSEGFFEYKINEIREKHCSSAGTIHFDELEIPDIKWDPDGSRWGTYIDGEIIIVDNSFLRSHINEFRFIIAGFVYFIWLLGRLYHILRILGVVDVDDAPVTVQQVVVRGFRP